MKKLVSFLFSMFFSVVLLMIFAIAIAYATFIENDYGTDTAQVLIYQARWFEILLFVGAVNLIGSMFRYKLVTRKKWAILMFHLAFVCIIIGAGVTRYFGFEGSMHIREGETTNKVVSESSYININSGFGSEQVSSSTHVKFTPNSDNSFETHFTVGGKDVRIENEIFVANATETIVSTEDGIPLISLIYSDGKSFRSDFHLGLNDFKSFPALSFGFEPADSAASIIFRRNPGGLMMFSKDTLVVQSPMSHEVEKLAPGTGHPVMPNKFYVSGTAGFVFNKFLPKATPALVQIPGEEGKTGINAITVKVTSGNASRKVNVLQTHGEELFPVSCVVDGVTVNISYGSIVRELPFSIKLNDFQIERYPGSNSPSSYASEITLIDPENKVERPFRIFMNNILNYNGYRFFQSSFDQDEKGTILSVNQDYWGTLVSYLGYLFMTLGMIFTLFNKHSRFQTVLRLSSKLAAKRQTLKIFTLGLLLTAFMGWNQTAFASTPAAAKDKHIRAFGELLVLDNHGRIEPVNTLASDLLRKISKKTSWDNMSPVQVFLDMSANSSKWGDVPVLKVSNSALSALLGVSGDFVSYNQMFDRNGNYKLNVEVQKSYNKKQTERNKFDKEIINLDERVNVIHQIFGGDFLKIFPLPGDENDSWVTAQMLPRTLSQQEFEFASNILKLYFEAYNDAVLSGNWSTADEYLDYIKKYQARNGSHMMPSSSKVKLEILYNEWNVFGKLAKILAFLGFVLLIFHFMLIFNSRKSIRKLIKIGTVLIFIAFLAYTAGLIMRWYISGHAPWSNGYETMIFIGWATILSGFIFVNRSQISLAVTTILTAIILFVAGMSWMNPEITNLVPVLKSYWLVVHVAIITSSYGFLAMGAILGMLNLVLMILRRKDNVQVISITILEVSYIIEMTLMIGLYLLTVGAFIGGVWANESWGRYWGWDPKETWALVTILVYAIVLHLRKVPGLKSIFGLSSLALVSLSSVIMTFFGVNYYLSGMHSYAQGNPPPIPVGIYIAIVLIIGLIAAAWLSEKKMGEITDPEDPQE